MIKQEGVLIYIVYYFFDHDLKFPMVLSFNKQDLEVNQKEKRIYNGERTFKGRNYTIWQVYLCNTNVVPFLRWYTSLEKTVHKTLLNTL